MPKIKLVLNAFAPRQVAVITGLSLHMINYLAREGYLLPSYPRVKARGNVRRYSYRDLVIAKVVKRLLDAGVEIARLKEAIRSLKLPHSWLKDGSAVLQLIVTDGRKLYFPDQNGSLIDLSQDLQSNFAFILDVGTVQAELKAQLTDVQLKFYSLRNMPMRVA